MYKIVDHGPGKNAWLVEDDNLCTLIRKSPRDGRDLLTKVDIKLNHLSYDEFFGNINLTTYYIYTQYELISILLRRIKGEGNITNSVRKVKKALK